MDLHQDDPNYKLVLVKKKIKVPKARLPNQKLSNPSLPEPHLQPVVISARSQEDRLGDRQQRRRRLSLDDLEPPAEQDEEDDTDTPAFR